MTMTSHQKDIDILDEAQVNKELEFVAFRARYINHHHSCWILHTLLCIVFKDMFTTMNTCWVRICYFLSILIIIILVEFSMFYILLCLRTCSRLMNTCLAYLSGKLCTFWLKKKTKYLSIHTKIQILVFFMWKV
jgi:hypothetical protein